MARRTSRIVKRHCLCGVVEDRCCCVGIGVGVVDVVGLESREQMVRLVIEATSGSRVTRHRCCCCCCYYWRGLDRCAVNDSVGNHKQQARMSFVARDKSGVGVGVGVDGGRGAQNKWTRMKQRKWWTKMKRIGSVAVVGMTMDPRRGWGGTSCRCRCRGCQNERRDLSSSAVSVVDDRMRKKMKKESSASCEHVVLLRTPTTMPPPPSRMTTMNRARIELSLLRWTCFAAAVAVVGAGLKAGLLLLISLLSVECDDWEIQPKSLDRKKNEGGRRVSFERLK